MPNAALEPAHWASNFVVADADQPVAPILGILQILRSNQWIVLFREVDQRVTGYFPFRKRELSLRLLREGVMQIAAEVLNLPQRGAEPLEQKKWRLSRPDEEFPERTRPVLVDHNGKLLAIGVARESGRESIGGRKPFMPGAQESISSAPSSLEISTDGIFSKDERDTTLHEYLGPDSEEKPGGPEPNTLPPVREATLSELIIPVFYATDRKPKHGTHRALASYTNERSGGQTSLGICSVSVPNLHKMGKFERPAWWKVWARPERQKHIIILSTVEMEAGLFYQNLFTSVHGSPRNDAFIFIHGYNVGFDTAASRTAQLAFDLGFSGAPILFSWPSRASVQGYVSDEGTIQWSRPHLSHFIEEVRARSQAEAVHLIAHSMGTRALLEVLHALAVASPGRQIFQQLILAAPDIDAGVFQQLGGMLNIICERVTLYASSNDKALNLSKKIHDFARAGEAGPNLIILGEMDTIDASKVDTDFLGHSTFMKQRSMIEDMFYLLTHGHPPSARFGLEARSCDQGPYWTFKE